MEQIYLETTGVYRALGFDVSPHWIGPLSLLDASAPEPLHVSEMAAAMKVSQPTMTQTVRGLINAGLIAAGRDKEDARKRPLSLTEKGRKAVEELRPLWEAFEQVGHELDEEVDGLIQRLDALELAMAERSVEERVLARYHERVGAKKDRGTS
jgi:DNA-binding MarR family transcriptional regulator